jgi:TPR repeat protein
MQGTPIGSMYQRLALPHPKGAPQPNASFRYSFPHRFPKDRSRALLWIRKAADQHDTDALTTLGNMYANGEGVPKNPALAFSWYLKAAEGGDAMCQCLVADIYCDGQGVEKDLPNAVQWYFK